MSADSLRGSRNSNQAPVESSHCIAHGLIFSGRILRGTLPGFPPSAERKTERGDGSARRGGLGEGATRLRHQAVRPIQPGHGARRVTRQYARSQAGLPLSIGRPEMARRVSGRAEGVGGMAMAARRRLPHKKPCFLCESLNKCRNPFPVLGGGWWSRPRTAGPLADADARRQIPGAVRVCLSRPSPAWLET
jgi:hypothetical protein